MNVESGKQINVETWRTDSIGKKGLTEYILFVLFKAVS